MPGSTSLSEAVDGSSQVLQVMSAGQAQIGAPGPGPVLAARARDVDVVFLYNLYPKSVFGLMVKDDSAYQTPEDLKGQVIGVGTADGAEVAFAQAILTDLGLTQDTDYTFLPVGDGGTAAVAFMGDEVEAYAAAVQRRCDPRIPRAEPPRDHARTLISPSLAMASPPFVTIWTGTPR